MDTLELKLYIYLRIRWASTQGIRFWWKAFSSPQTWIRIWEANPSDMRTKKYFLKTGLKTRINVSLLHQQALQKKDTLQSTAYKWQSRTNDAQRRRAVHQNAYRLLPRHSRVIWFLTTSDDSSLLQTDREREEFDRERDMDGCGNWWPNISTTLSSKGKPN